MFQQDSQNPSSKSALSQIGQSSFIGKNSYPLRRLLFKLYTTCHLGEILAVSNKRDVVSAPMSFAGSLGRTQNWLWHDKEVWFKAAIGWWAVPMVVMMWWMIILCWYMVWGIFLIPYRMIRRGSRKRKVQDRQHKEMLEAIRQNGIQK
jgi:hypothetical protein